MIVQWAKQACRLFSVMDALYVVGNFLYKRSLRYTMATATISLVGYLGNLLPGIDTYPARVAVLLPLCVGGTVLTTGLLLKIVPALIQSRLANVAQAADLDLMENYRKWRTELHLESLWDRVYQYEWTLGTCVCHTHRHHEECPEWLTDEDGLPDDPQQRGRALFLRRAQFALDRPQPEARQRYYLGLDLRYVEDWYNGGYFDPSDRKLTEQFSAASTLVRIREETGYKGIATLADLPLATFARFWFAMLCRAVEMRIGAAVECLNSRFDTDYFNAQALLWPGEENEPWLLQFDGEARRAVLELRRDLLWRIFGDNDAEMFRIVDRFVWPQFFLASKLRALYDPEYLDGSLGYDVLDDFSDDSLSPRRRRWFETLRDRTRQDSPLLTECLGHDVFSRLKPHPLADEGKIALRALRVAVHTNRNRLRERLHAFAEKPYRQTEIALTMLPEVEYVVAHRYLFTHRLVALRVHHELARIQRREYHALLSDLLTSCRGLGADREIPAESEPCEVT